MSTLIESEIITKQQELIESYKLVLDTYKTSKETLYKFLETIYASLQMNDPVVTENAINHLGKLLEGRK
jgi:flagellar capping protein FliD